MLSGTISETKMTTTFAEYAAQQDAKNTIYLNIVKYGLMLCDALQQDAPDGYFYELESSGRKYHKIWMHIGDRRDSIHAFIDKQTGSVFKPASCRGPFKDQRYNLLLIKDREWLFENVDWCGKYLYKK